MGHESEYVQKESDQAAARASRETMSVVRARERHASQLVCVPSPSQDRRRVCVTQAVVRAPPHVLGRTGTPLGMTVCQSITAPSGAQAPRTLVHGGATTSRRTLRHSLTRCWKGALSSPVSTQITWRRGRFPARGRRRTVPSSRSQMVAASTCATISHPSTSPSRYLCRPCMPLSRDASPPRPLRSPARLDGSPRVRGWRGRCPRVRIVLPHRRSSMSSRTRSTRETISGGSLRKETIARG
jgi:hypothetical protein